MAEIIESVDEIESKKVALMDLEGTLTPGNREVPSDADSTTMEQVLGGAEIKGGSEVGYWSGLHLLGGEHPDDYFERVEKWKDGSTSNEEFENRNTEIWNNVLDQSEYEDPKDFVDWYNRSFLHFRDRSQELINLCHERGLEVGVVSHTSTSLSKTAAENLGAEYVFPTWEFKFESGKFTAPEKKVYAEDGSLLVPKLRDSGVKKIVFYGNAQNDVKIADKADEAYMVGNKDDLNYSKVKAFTGTFEEVIEASKEVAE